MALDWIKMRTDIYRDPKVIIIADLLMNEDSELAVFVSQVTQSNMTVTRNVTRNAVVGALVSIWGVIRHQGERVEDDLMIRGATSSAVDDIADLPGIGDAMSEVGWVVTSNEGIIFPGFFSENNTDPNEIRRTKNAEKQRRYRDKKSGNSDVTRDVTRYRDVTTREREEKRREENISPLSLQQQQKDANESNQFTPPTFEELEIHVMNAGVKVEVIQEFYDYYCANGWQTSRGTMADWKAALRRWLRNEKTQSKTTTRNQKGAGDNGRLESSLSAIERFAARHAGRSSESTGSPLRIEADG